MKKTYSLFALVFIVANAFSQSQFNCNSDSYFQQQLKNNPSFKINQDILEKQTALSIKNNLLNKSSVAPTYIIPVVFHVIYTNGKV